MPRTVAEVSQLLAICHREELAVVPHGGNTSYCGGATPDETGAQIVLSMRRLNRIRKVDATNYSMIVEAGCTLAEAQAAARAADRLFPLSLGSEGTAQIGGNLSTNAGGTAVLRYGMMRDLVLGLEVVLADGRVMPGLKNLRKDNTGYDVKSLFIGAEGTLGVITAASLKLFPLPADTATALAGTRSPQLALDLLGTSAQCGGRSGEHLRTDAAFCRRTHREAHSRRRGSARQGAPWYLLIELTSPNPHQDSGRATDRSSARGAAEAGLIGMPPSQRRSRNPRPCGNCANRSRRRSATTARASSTMSRCPSR